MLDSESPVAAGITLDLEREQSALVLDLDQIADLIDNGRTDEAMRLIENARARTKQKTDPIKVVDDIASDIDQVLGIADLLTCSPAEELTDGTLARVGYAIESILMRAKNRVRAARGPTRAEREVLCRGLEMVLNDCKTDAEFAIATRLQSEMEVSHG